MDDSMSKTSSEVPLLEQDGMITKTYEKPRRKYDDDSPKHYIKRLRYDVHARLGELCTRKVLIGIGVMFLTAILILVLTRFFDKNPSPGTSEPTMKRVPRRQPHVVFIVADDIGWNDVSWHNKDIHTPNLANLAKTGVTLEKYYTYATCTPSRAAVLTGYYAHRLGLQHRVIEEYQKKHVPTDIPMMAEVLRKEGYSTHAVGKWHLGHCNWNYTPTYRGFDTFFGYKFSTEDYYTHKYQNKVYEFWENEEPYFDTDQTYSTELLSARAQNITKEHALKFGNEKPMYMYLAFQNIHGPQEDPPPQYHVNTTIKVRNRQIVTNSLNALDRQVGYFVKTLKSTGLYENTLIVFVSDNGGEISNGGNNMPFRGGKFTAWEGGTHVPAFIHGRLLAKPGRVHQGLFHVVDWFPTLLRAIGLKRDLKAYRGDGIDMWESLSSGKTSQRQSFVYEIDPRRTAAIREGRYKLILGNPVDSTYSWSLRRGPDPHGNPNCLIAPNEYFRRQSCNTEVSDTMLFDIDKDPSERFNLAQVMPDVLERLKEKIELEKKRTVSPQDETGYKSAALRLVKNNVMYPGWC